MPAMVVQAPDRHTLVKGAKQYDFIPHSGDGECAPYVEVNCYAPRMTFMQVLLVEEARQLYQRLMSSGFVAW